MYCKTPQFWGCTDKCTDILFFFSIPILLLWYSMILVDVFHFTLKYYFFFRFISIFSPFSCSMSTLSCLNDRLDHPLLISFNTMPSFVLTAVNMRKIAFLGISLCLLCGSVIAQYICLLGHLIISLSPLCGSIIAQYICLPDHSTKYLIVWGTSFILYHFIWFGFRHLGGRVYR